MINLCFGVERLGLAVLIQDEHKPHHSGIQNINLKLSHLVLTLAYYLLTSASSALTRV